VGISRIKFGVVSFSRNALFTKDDVLIKGPNLLICLKKINAALAKNRRQGLTKQNILQICLKIDAALASALAIVLALRCAPLFVRMPSAGV
jgi:hypothetical protein